MGPIKVKKPQAILFDLSGTATKSYFTDKILFPYIKQNCQTYISNNWDNEILQRDIQRLREQSRRDSGPEIADKDAPKSEIERTVCAYVFKALEDLRESDAINIFRLHMWFDGYNRNKLETPVYSDVAIQIKHWRITQNIKLYVLSNGWTEATKRFMSKTNHGDLNLLIDDHFDTTQGPLTEPETYRKVLRKIALNPDEVLFLTKSVPESRAAKMAGLNVILVMTHRRDLARMDDKDKEDNLFVRSFNEIMFITDGSSPAAASQASSASSVSSVTGGSSAASAAPPSGAPASRKSSTKSSASRGRSMGSAASATPNSSVAGGVPPKQGSRVLISKSASRASSAAPNKSAVTGPGVSTMLASKPKSRGAGVVGTIFSATSAKAPGPGSQPGGSAHASGVGRRASSGGPVGSKASRTHTKSSTMATGSRHSNAGGSSKSNVSGSHHSGASSVASSTTSASSANSSSSSASASRTGVVVVSMGSSAASKSTPGVVVVSTGGSGSSSNCSSGSSSTSSANTSSTLSAGSSSNHSSAAGSSSNHSSAAGSSSKPSSKSSMKSNKSGKSSHA